MTKEEVAKIIDIFEYPVSIPHYLASKAKESGLVIVYGASDDLIEFDGAIYDEAGAWGGGTYQIDKDGLLPLREEITNDDELERFFARRKTAKTIKAIWDRDGYSWLYETDIPHATFDIFDDGEKYCRGIVFSLNDLG